MYCTFGSFSHSRWLQRSHHGQEVEVQSYGWKNNKEKRTRVPNNYRVSILTWPAYINFSVREKLTYSFSLFKKMYFIYVQFQVYNKIERQVQRFPTCPLPPHSLPHCQHGSPEWYTFTKEDTSQSPNVHSSLQGLLWGLYVKWLCTVYNDTYPSLISYTVFLLPYLYFL